MCMLDAIDLLLPGFTESSGRMPGVGLDFETLRAPWESDRFKSMETIDLVNGNTLGSAADGTELLSCLPRSNAIAEAARNRARGLLPPLQVELVLLSPTLLCKEDSRVRPSLLHNWLSEGNLG